MLNRYDTTFFSFHWCLLILYVNFVKRIFFFLFSQETFTAPVDGLYQVVLTCYDLAGNFKSARQIFLYDSSSTIDITPGHKISDSLSSTNTTHTWVVTPATSVTIEWDGHFVNTRHKNNQWLTGVKAYGGIDKTSKYEDSTGVITINNIDHEDGKC